MKDRDQDENTSINIHKISFISSPSQALFILSPSRSPDIKLKQTLFFIITLGMFEHCALDCHAEPQLTSKDAF